MPQTLTGQPFSSFAISASDTVNVCKVPKTIFCRDEAVHAYCAAAEAGLSALGTRTDAREDSLAAKPAIGQLHASMSLPAQTTQLQPVLPPVYGNLRLPSVNLQRVQQQQQQRPAYFSASLRSATTCRANAFKLSPSAEPCADRSTKCCTKSRWAQLPTALPTAPSATAGLYKSQFSSCVSASFICGQHQPSCPS